ncbi:MAG: HAD family phosphatase [Paludibacteraceae bacterium]|nr:HAD family phosphatase [Paludibacteraceae bacterium]
MIKNLIFDFGGVLIDADLEGAIRNFQALGMENISEYLNLYRQNGLFLDLEDGTKNRQEFNDAFREITGKSATDQEIEAAWLSIVERVDMDKLRYLEELRKHYKVYLLSNINPHVYDWANSSSFSSLGKPLPDYFDIAFASYQLKMTKPSPEIFQYVIDQTGLSPEETIFVDDGTRNVETARLMGFHVYQPKNREDWRPVVAHMLETL